MSRRENRPQRRHPGHTPGGAKPPAAQVAAEHHPVPGWLFGMILLLWWTGGYGAVVYSLIEDRGPFTFLLSWQEALFGGSNLLVAAGIAAIVIFLGPSWLIRGLHRLWPSSPVLADLDSRMRRATRSRAQIAAEAHTRWATAGAKQRAQLARRSRNSALIVAAALMALSGAIALWVHVTADADAGEPLTPVTVGLDAPIALGGASDWVHITDGAPRRDAVVERDYTIRRHAYRDYYTPIVPAGWTQADRIYLLEKDVTSPDDHAAEGRPAPPGPVEGKLSTGGPRADITQTFQQHGYGVGPWTAVLRRHFDLGGKIPGEDIAVSLVIWFEGGIFTFIALMIAAINQRRLRRALAEASQAANP